MRQIKIKNLLSLILLLFFVSCKSVTTIVQSVAITPTSKDLYEGETFQLEAIVKPTEATDKTLVWTSANGNVTVDQSGKITAVKEGTSIVTATAKDGSGAKATCKITVQAKVVNVQSVTITPTSKDLYEGETFQLEAIVKPTEATDKTLEWTSTNGNVTVDQSGKITAVKEGTSIVTATAKDGSGAKATCKITVQTKVVNVQSVTITPTSKDLYEGETFQLEAIVKPAEATDKTLVWTSTNGNVTVDQSGKITAVKEGTSIVTATAKDGSGAKATCTITVKKRTNYGYTKADYYQWDAYASCDKQDTGKWEPNSSTYHDGESVTVTQSCKDSPTSEQMKMYLGAGVYWDDDGLEYSLPNGKTYKTGLWVKKSSKISGFDDNTATKKSYIRYNDGTGLFKRGKPNNTSDYFFLPACGYFNRRGSFSYGDTNGYYWLSTARPRYTDSAYSLHFLSGYAYVKTNDERCLGFVPMPSF